MLVRVENHGWIGIPIDFERRWTSIYGNSTIIPINRKWKTIGIQVSGGLDSALLLYLTSRTILENNLDIRIKPISFEIPTKVKSLGSARAVISTVKDVLGFDQMADPVEIILPIDDCQPPLKDRFIDRAVMDLINRKEIDFEFNGNTKNPPQHVRSNFKNDKHRQFGRDARTTIYNGEISASPHAFMTKQDIVDLYRQNGLIGVLSDVTLSCDENADVIEKLGLPVPCGQCWWCRERAWGFEALEDKEMV